MFARRRPLLRAAAVGGAAYMAGKSRAQRQADAEQSQAVPAQAAPAQPAPPAQPGQQAQPGQAVTDQLSRLASLHEKGALSDTEFAAAKAKLLGT